MGHRGGLEGDTRESVYIISSEAALAAITGCQRVRSLSSDAMLKAN